MMRRRSRHGGCDTQTLMVNRSSKIVMPAKRADFR
jgi:hypothetical protein